MKILAIACDGGVPECSDNEDEGWLCGSSLSWYGTVLAVSLIFMFSLIYNCYHGIRKVFPQIRRNQRSLRGLCLELCKGKSKDNEDEELLKLPDVLNKNIFMCNHHLKTFKEDLNLFIERSKVCDTKSARIQKNQRLYQLELSIHGGNMSETTLCIKNNIDVSNAKILIDDAFPGIMRRYFPKIEDLLDRLDANSWIYWLMN